MLKDAEFKVVYSTGETEPAEFFIDALLESQSFDLALGFFSSSGFRALSAGFAYFISRGGKMRIIFNDVLTSEDKEAIEKGFKSDPKKLIESNIISDIIKLANTLAGNDRHFFNCISWLIATHKLEMIAIRPIGHSPGIAHQKFGIFSDVSDERVAFSGSINFSITALFKNLEAISCYRSWTFDKSDSERIKYYEGLFQKIWTGKHENVTIVPIEKVKVVIRERFPINSIESLIDEGASLLDDLRNQRTIPITLGKKLATLQQRLTTEVKPPPSLPKTVNIRNYQATAVNAWINNHYRGLFEMATASGKTITGLYAAVKLFEKLNKVFLLILVPTISLAQQWNEEVTTFNFSEIVLVSSDNPGWAINLQAELNSFRLGTIKHLVVISTYNSFRSKKFENFYGKFPVETMLLADEAHNMGAPEVLKKLPVTVNYRLALTATPHRHFDESGTQKLLDYFNVGIKSTFVFSLKDAIANQFLCQYKLYPHFAELNEIEYKGYISLTKQIAKRAYFQKKKFINTDPILERLLNERRQILNRAEAKLKILGDIIDRMKIDGSIRHTLVYCPEGNDEREDNRIIDEIGKYLAFEKELRIGQFTGTTEPQKREQLLTDFDKGTIQCLLAMKCLDEGIDVKQTETAIFMSSSTNPRQYIQRRGRILRVHFNKTFAKVHDIIAIPPNIGIDDPKTKEVDHLILQQEFRRYKEFAEDAVNYVDAMTPVKRLCKEYKIEI